MGRHGRQTYVLLFFSHVLPFSPALCRNIVRTSLQAKVHQSPLDFASYFPNKQQERR